MLVFLTSLLMINSVSVVKIFADRASNSLSSIVSNNATVATTVTDRECGVVDPLCGVLESITSSHSQAFEVETTLDHELANYKDKDGETWDPDWNEETKAGRNR
jgi:hypothetical protein